MSWENIFPLRLVEIKDFLLMEDISFKTYSKDGRINSAFNEDEITKIISKNFQIDLPKTRAWFDFSFQENNIFYPVNIKISTTNTTDNINCKLGIYYALTGEKPDFPNEIAWKIYFQKLKNNMKENEVDYYFLIMNKNNTDDIFITSLKSLKSIVPSGNNLPFQAKWGDNREPIYRSFSGAKDFLLSCFSSSLKLRSQAYFSFKDYFNDYA